MKRPRRPVPGRRPEAGVTLVEMLVALSIFSLIGAAGFTILDQALLARSHLVGRHDDLATVQRALFIWRLDLMQAVQVAAGPIGEDAGGSSIRLRLSDGTEVDYQFRGTSLFRAARQGDAAATEAALLDGVADLGLRYLDEGGTWADVTPAAVGSPAVELRVTLDPGNRMFRSVIGLPYTPDSADGSQP